MSDPTPILLVTGALGAGKTTLINHMIKAARGRKLAAVVNDFGSINIDQAVLSSTGELVYGLQNGCICCSLQGDLLRTIKTILSHGESIEGILIEASGVSDPRAIIEALHDPVLHQVVRLDSVVVVVDAENWDSLDQLWMAQVRAADFVVVTKAHCSDQRASPPLNTVLEAMNKAMIFFADADGGIPCEVFFTAANRRHEQSRSRSFLHLTDDRFTRFEWSSEKFVSVGRFQSVIQALTPQLVRAKGFLSFDDRPRDVLLFQLVGRRASLLPISQVATGVQLIFIGKAGILDVERAKAALETM